ncbi:MAG: substrate-binding domain-containing protein [Pseudomonadota bacterium]
MIRILQIAILACVFGWQAQASERPRIGAALYGLEAEFMQLWSAAIKQHPSVTSGDVDLKIFDGAYSEQTQSDQFDEMIGDAYDAIIFVPLNETLGADLVSRAHAAGIPVIGSNTRVDSDLVTAYIGSDDVEGGYLEAIHVLETMGCRGNVVILEGPIGQSAQLSRLEGNRKALAECPEVKILEQATANWQETEAKTLMATWLEAHGSAIKGVIGQNDEMALGAIDAIKSNDLSVFDFIISGIDGVTAALEAVERGEMTSILQDAVAQSQGALDLALHHLDPTYEPQSAIWEKYPTLTWQGGTQGDYVVPWTPVAIHNVAELLEERTQLQNAAGQ